MLLRMASVLGDVFVDGIALLKALIFDLAFQPSRRLGVGFDGVGRLLT